MTATDSMSPAERRHDGAAGNPGPLDIIRRQLTEGAVRSMDRRALFVGVDPYEAADRKIDCRCRATAAGSPCETLPGLDDAPS
jgi:hypothetical protein